MSFDFPDNRDLIIAFVHRTLTFGYWTIGYSLLTAILNLDQHFVANETLLHTMTSGCMAFGGVIWSILLNIYNTDPKELRLAGGVAVIECSEC